MKTFGQIQAESCRLLEIGYPASATVLQIIKHITPAEACYLAQNGDLPSEVISRISATTGLQSRVIAIVAKNTIRLDLSDYADGYNHILDQYREAGSPVEEIEAFFAGRKRGEFYFLLHGPHICVWDSEYSELCDLIIGNDDGDFDLMVAGYLVARGFAFGNTVQALRIAFEQQWSNWEAFWSAF